jgi:hypothetical protein
LIKAPDGKSGLFVGAFKTHLRQYCGPERTPPLGRSGSAQFGNGFMTQDTTMLLRRESV